MNNRKQDRGVPASRNRQSQCISLSAVVYLAAIAAAAINPREANADFAFGPPANLGPLINSAAWDNAALFSQDGLCLYFQKDGATAYMAIRDTKYDSWSTVVNLGTPTVVDDCRTIFKPLPILPGWTTGDGLEIYWGGSFDIWTMKRPAVGADWSPPVNLGSPVNTSYDEIWATISSDGLELYFSGFRSGAAYVRPGGQGNADLWVTKRATRDSPWGAPVNLGAVVNSSYQDARPHLSADGLVLFFDSQRSGGYGSGDLYMTRRATRSSPWGPPVNLGPLINSSLFEEGASISPDGSTIHWDCARPGGYGSNDIWQASITPVIDFNGDGKVDAGDMAILVNNWGGSTSLCDIGPFPWGDGIVDAKDLAVFLKSTVSPAEGALDVPRDVILSWMSTPLAQAYDVYFGSSEEAVENANRDTPLGVLVSQGQPTNTCDLPELLEFNHRYFWRVDVIGSSPQSPIYKGLVLSFKTELAAYPIQNVTATASSFDRGKGPENTVNSSGLTNDLHGTDVQTMWLSSTGGPTPVWIQYSFDKVYRMDQLWVWNYNYVYESMFGLGPKDVTLQYSTNGSDWATLGDFVLNQAPGADGCAHDTTISLGGIAAQQIKIIIKSGWAGQSRYGLSEVRFFYIPTYASRPQPTSGQTGMGVDTTLSWQAGREASLHQVYFDTDKEAVINGTVPNATLSQTACDPGPLDLGTTYYWRVDEVNEAKTPGIWPGDLWSFSTLDYLTVDDMESYGSNLGVDTVFDFWSDGYVSTGVASSTNGALVGYDEAKVDLTATPPINHPDFLEGTIVNTLGGSTSKRSLPFRYGVNTAAPVSEITLDVPKKCPGRTDWTAAGIKTLVMYVRGDPTNTAGQLFVKINGTRVNYNGDAADIAAPLWKQWNIDLSSLSGLKVVKTLTIGVSGTGKGILYIDDIRLYRVAPGVGPG